MNRPGGRPRQAPPLWLWPVAVAVVAGFIAATLDDYIDDAVTRTEAENHAQRARISEFARQRADHPQALHVIAFGDSSLRNATFFDEEMERYSLANGGPEIRFLRVTRAGARLHDYLALFAAAFAAEPELLLLESSLVPDDSNRRERHHHRIYRAGGIPRFHVPREQHRERLLRGYQSLQHQTWIANSVLAKLGGWLRVEVGVGNRFNERQRRIVCRPAHNRRVLARHESRYPPGGEATVDPTSATTFDLLVEQASAAGTTLVFIDIPVASPIADLPGVRRRAALQRGFFALYANHPAFAYWGIDRSIPDSHYCDWIHLSPEGRPIYAAWLVEQLRRFSAERNER